MFTLSQTAQRTQDWLSDPGSRPRRAGLAISIMMFVAGLIWSLQAFAGSAHTLLVWPLAILLFVFVPLTTVLNATEFKLMSRMAGAGVDWAQSFETTIYASAANMLPLPGGVIARVAALKAHGATVRFGSMIVVLFAAIWGGHCVLLYRRMAGGTRPSPTGRSFRGCRDRSVNRVFDCRH